MNRRKGQTVCTCRQARQHPKPSSAATSAGHWPPAPLAQSAAQKSDQAQTPGSVSSYAAGAWHSTSGKQCYLSALFSFIACFIACLLLPHLGTALYTVPTQEKGGGRIQGREAKRLWGSIKIKVARVKNYNQGTRGGHQTPPKSIRHSSKATKETEDTAQCDKQWEWE